MKSFIVVLLFLCTENFAQEVIFPVAPLGQNNLWVYKDTYSTSTYKTIRIIDTAKYVDSIKYFEVEVKGVYKRLYRLRDDGYYVMWVDTSYPEPNHEAIYYKKDSKIGNQWKSVWGSIAINETTIVRDTVYYSIIDTAQVHFFNKIITIKLLYMRNYGGLLDHHQIWSDEFGLLSDDHGEGFTDNLKGCIIDNVLYGDTTITDVKENKVNIFDYSLSQNYPNPFNSTTTIEYEISSITHVNLTVFNSIGESISILVNEVKPRGMYKIKFFADNLPSGIYFYRLISGSKTITNKMALLK